MAYDYKQIHSLERHFCLEENHKRKLCAILNTRTMKIKQLICLIQHENVWYEAKLWYNTLKEQG